MWRNERRRVRALKIVIMNQMNVKSKESALLFTEIMKSRSSTSMDSGFSSRRSFDLYIWGYRRCTAFRAASVQRA